jgi:hypothetical protein
VAVNVTTVPAVANEEGGSETHPIEAHRKGDQAFLKIERSSLIQLLVRKCRGRQGFLPAREWSSDPRLEKPEDVGNAILEMFRPMLFPTNC